MLLLSQSAIRIITDRFVSDWVIPMMKNRLLKRFHCHVVVIDPSVTWLEGRTLQEAVAFEASVNLDGKPFQYPYVEIARGKAMLSLRTGRSSREVVEFAPHLLLKGDVLHPGSAVVNGLIVAISGFDNWDDEALAAQLAWELWRFAKSAYAARMLTDSDFLS